MRFSDQEAIRAARRKYEREGEIEVRDHAFVSRINDRGCYVKAWVWVSNEEVRPGFKLWPPWPTTSN